MPNNKDRFVIYGHLLLGVEQVKKAQRRVKSRPKIIELLFVSSEFLCTIELS